MGIRKRIILNYCEGHFDRKATSNFFRNLSCRYNKAFRCQQLLQRLATVSYLLVHNYESLAEMSRIE